MTLKIVIALMVLLILYLVWAVRRLQKENLTLFTIMIEHSILLKEILDTQEDIFNEEGDLNVTRRNKTVG